MTICSGIFCQSSLPTFPKAEESPPRAVLKRRDPPKGEKKVVVLFLLIFLPVLVRLGSFFEGGCDPERAHLRRHMSLSCPAYKRRNKSKDGSLGRRHYVMSGEGIGHSPYPRLPIGLRDTATQRFGDHLSHKIRACCVPQR